MQELGEKQVKDWLGGMYWGSFVGDEDGPMINPGPPKLDTDWELESCLRTELRPQDDEEADMGLFEAEAGKDEDEGLEKEGMEPMRSSRFCSANEGDRCLKPL